MPWGAAVGAVVGSVANNALSSKSNGGAGSTTTDKSPWAAAQPWILNNMTTGQNLENQYLASPQSSQQQAATNSIYGQDGYMQSLVPSLLGQLQSQPVGFDPSNPTAKATPWNWNASGLLGSQSSPGAVPPPAAPAAAPAGTFKQQGLVSYDPWSGNPDPAALDAKLNGGYGAFKYGDHPAAGTQAYADMNTYKNYGGADPLNAYGWNPPPPTVQYPNAGGS